MLLYLGFAGQEAVQGPVQPVVIYLALGYAQEIAKGTPLVEVLCYAQLAGGIAEPHQNQRHSHHGPGELLPACRHQSLEEGNEVKLVGQFQAKPIATEVTDPLDAYPLGVHLHPFRFTMLVKQAALPVIPVPAGCLLDPQALALSHITEISHHSLARTTLCPVRLHQLPIDSFLLLFRLTAPPEIHGEIIATFPGAVFGTTSGFGNRSRS
jgi:hypothetical protein